MTTGNNEVASPQHRATGRPVVKFLVVAVAVVAYCAIISSPAFAAESFYWKDSHGRGVGTPALLACKDPHKVVDAGLCYWPCKSGYNGVAEYCWKNHVSFLRFDDYFRGFGKDNTELNCPAGKVYDAGLCYKRCRAGYKAEGPVCWAKTPPGYIDCGAGFATDKMTCATTMAGQIVAAASLTAGALGAAAKATQDTEKAAMDADEASAVKRVLNKVKQLGSDISAAIKDTKPARALDSADQKITDFFGGKEGRMVAEIAYRMMKGGTTLAIKSNGGFEGYLPIDYARLTFAFTSMWDPSPVSGFMAAYLYPVYKGGQPKGGQILNPHTHTAPANTPGNHANSIFAVSNNASLYAYAVKQSGRVRTVGQIGNGWGGIRDITAGNNGNLFALGNGGRTLYFYHLDHAYHWTKISVQVPGARFSEMKAVFAAGNVLGQNFYHAVRAWVRSPWAHRKPIQVGDIASMLFAEGKNGDLWLYKLQPTRGGNYKLVDRTRLAIDLRQYRRVVVGFGGQVFGITPNGDMYAYQITLPSSARPEGARASNRQFVGPGWNRYKKVFGGARGTIYAVATNGSLDMYRKVSTGWFGPEKIGNGWGGMRLITAAKDL